MPKLDQRLSTVAEQIRGRVHADIGSDHGYLLKALLTSKRIEHGIAIENKPAPFENSRATLLGLNADVRLADGLQGLRENEADSLSLCGMGGELIVKILSRFPRRIPKTLIVQPNNHHEVVRRWGLEQCFHLVDERLVHCKHTYVTLQFQRHEQSVDPAYNDLEKHTALLFGPHLIRRRDPELIRFLERERQRLGQYRQRTDASSQRLEAVALLLNQFGSG